MVFLLVLDVIGDGIHMGIADTEHAITILPCKWMERTILLINPFRAIRLYGTYNVRWCHRLILDVEYVNMVCGTSNHYCRTFDVIEDCRNIFVNIIKMLLGYGVRPPLGGENEMYV